ncbi:phosphotransferase [Janibacter hoylei]|uniref:phosphotransferase n=1 Tax=Janibacter hoylei TaxID=364298 RepID=UPI0012E9DE48|nr:phosphotransferase [Janibacter hoylei]
MVHAPHPREVRGTGLDRSAKGVAPQFGGPRLVRWAGDLSWTADSRRTGQRCRARPRPDLRRGGHRDRTRTSLRRRLRPGPRAPPLGHPLPAHARGLRRPRAVGRAAGPAEPSPDHARPGRQGWVPLPEGGRAAVSAYLTGRRVELASIAPGSALASGLGRALAQLHNLDRRIFEEAGVPVYEAEAYRTRRLAELDRAAAMGRVPTGLLTRWERTLEDLSLWRFTTTPTHGAIGGGTVLATPDDGEEPEIKGFLGWESAQVADPADDLAALVDELHPEALDTVMEAYAHARADRPDRHLHRRARLVHEMSLVRSMMTAVAAGDDEAAEDLARQLRRLDDRLADEEDLAPAPVGGAAAGSAADEETTGDDAPAAQETTEGSEQSGTAEAAQTEASEQDPTAQDPTEPDASQPDAAEADPTEPDASQSEDTPQGELEPDAAESDEAVEIEHVGEPTPATPTQAGTNSTIEPTASQPGADSDAGPEDRTSGAPTEAPGAATPERPRTQVRLGPPSDHETAEITPLVGDDGDDVVPPSPRR